jgi:uncharacterized protein (TIGR03067 family)
MLRACLIAVAVFAAPAAADDLKELAGEWKIESATLGGKDIGLKGLTLILAADGSYESKLPDSTDKGKFTADEKAMPKGMEIISETEGPLKGKKLPAIYELKKDTLTICYDMDMKARPAKLESAAGTNVLMVVYNRGKK